MDAVALKQYRAEFDSLKPLARLNRQQLLDAMKYLGATAQPVWSGTLGGNPSFSRRDVSNRDALGSGQLLRGGRAYLKRVDMIPPAVPKEKKRRVYVKGVGFVDAGHVQREVPNLVAEAKKADGGAALRGWIAIVLTAIQILLSGAAMAQDIRDSGKAEVTRTKAAVVRLKDAETQMEDRELLERLTTLLENIYEENKK